MEYQDPAEKRNAEWNGNPADYPWFEFSPRRVAAFEPQELEEVLPDGGTRREMIEYLDYLDYDHELKDYLRSMPEAVWEYREKLRKERDSSHADEADASGEISDDDLPF